MHKRPGRDQFLHGEQADIVPVAQFAHAVAQKGLETGNLFAKVFNPSLAKLIRCALRNDKATLPVILAVDHYEHFAGFRVAEGLIWIAGAAADPHPQDIHGCA